MNQTELAKLSNYSVGHINDLRMGRKNMTLPAAKKLAEACAFAIKPHEWLCPDEFGDPWEKLSKTNPPDFQVISDD